MTRKSGALGAHPDLEYRDERGDMLAAEDEPILGRAAVDLPFLVEDRVDLAYGLARERGWRTLAGLSQIGELEEATPGMGPAERLGDRPAGASRHVQPGEAAI